MFVTKKDEKVDQSDDKKRNQSDFSIHDWSLRVWPPHEKECKETSDQEGGNCPTVTIANEATETGESNEHFPAEHVFGPASKTPYEGHSNNQRRYTLKYKLCSEDSIELKMF